MILKITLIICLVWMFYQDIRFRAIYWLSFPLLLVLLVTASNNTTGLAEILNNTVFNLLILIIQFVFVSAGLSLKYKRMVNITTDHIGWGDLLFLLVITVYFSPANYFLFYVSSLIAVLLVSLPGLINATKEFKIPLAGLQAIFLAMILLLNWMGVIPSLTNDNWIIDRLVL